ncbi:hypothetical protein HMN09_00467300 [Mycena chlorophos]|uniref:Uncharacterized protein n=1 Tax=Mycena chlorophos TaxID=658473 RepID=A0A8H6TII1_MYCCL|nr:hypothetical protein HMN09_00467300 [Mycena chlorophos]
MKFASVLVAFVAVSASSVVAAPAGFPGGFPHFGQQAGGKAAKGVAAKGQHSGFGGNKGSSSSSNSSSVSVSSGSGSTVSLSNSTSTDDSSVSSVDDASVSSVDDASVSSVDDASVADDSSLSSLDNAESSNSTATSTSNSTDVSSSTATAASSTRTRPCDQGDQSLASGLTSAVTVGLGLQASVLTLQNISTQADFSADDFSTAVQRLQQFQDTMGLQIQMAQGIADDDSFAQPQLGLLAAAQNETQASIDTLSGVKSAADVTAAASTLSTLLSSFLAVTNNAQDGAEQALIDCFLPTTAVSG